MIRVVGVLLMWLVAPGFVFSQQGGQTVPTAAVLIDRYEESSRILAGAEFQLSGAAFLRGGAFPEETLVRNDIWNCRFDGNHWFIDQHGTFVGIRRGKQRTTANHIEFVVSDDGMVHVQESSGNFVVVGSKDPAVGLLRGMGQVESGYHAFDEAALFFGLLHGNGPKSLAAVLRESNPSVTEEMLVDRPTWRLEGQGRFGNVVVWLDPEQDCAPRRIEVQKGPEALFGSQPVAAYRKTGRGAGLWPDLDMREVSIVVDNVQFDNVDEPSLMTGFRQVKHVTYAEGEAATLRFEATLNGFRRVSDFAGEAFKVTMEIPDGTRVTMRDTPQIPHQWSSGLVLAAVDRAAARNVRGVQFVQPSPSRTAVVAVNIAVLVLVPLLVVIHRWRAGRRADH